MNVNYQFPSNFTVENQEFTLVKIQSNLVILQKIVKSCPILPYGKNVNFMPLSRYFRKRSLKSI